MNLFIPTVHAQLSTVSEETTGGLADFLGSFLINIPLWIAGILVFGFTFFLAGLLKKIVISRIVRKAQQEVHQEVLLLVGRAVYFGILILGIVVSFGIVKVDLWALVGAMGIGLGFAFKDLFSNFIAGVVILTQKRFTIGDIVEVNQVRGVIQDIDTRISVLKTYDGTHMVIPNSEMLNSTVQVFTAEDRRRRIFKVPIHYKASLDQVIPLIEASVGTHESVLSDPAVHVLATEFGEHAITLEVRYWIKARDRWPLIESAVIRLAKSALDKAHIPIPSPIRALSLDPYDPHISKIISR